DMASTANAVREYNGNDDEDIVMWLKEAKLIVRIAGLNEEQATQLLLFKLRGPAQTWAANAFASEGKIQLSELCLQLTRRFSNSKNKMEKLNKFMSIKAVSNKAELRELTSNASFLMMNKYMDAEPLIKLTILKCPPEIRAILYQATVECYDWNEFLKAIDNTAWMAFPNEAEQVPMWKTEEVICPVRKDTQVRKKKFSTKKKERRIKEGGSEKEDNCIIHGRCKHNTKSCWTLKMMDEKGLIIEKERTKSVKVIHEGEEQSEDSLNYQGAYSTHTTKNYKNVFKCKIHIGQIISQGLIDTGADISLIHRSLTPKTWRIHKNDQGDILAANGGKIKIIGKICNFPISIDNRIYFTEAHVTDQNPRYVILGINFISKYPELLQNKLNLIGSKVKEPRKTANIVKILDLKVIENAMFEEFKETFDTEIRHDRLCTVDKHKIVLINERPFKEISGRIPVHWRDEIKAEIEKY
ncbi:MAG: retropepsin-like aspartic protease, partial [Aeromonas sp.]